MSPKAAPIGRTYGLPKTYKQFQHLFQFGPMTDTLRSPYPNRRKFLTWLLFSSAQNTYVVKGSAIALLKQLPK